MNFLSLFGKKKNFTKDDVARMLKVDPEFLAKFEEAYYKASMLETEENDYVNAKTAKQSLNLENTPNDLSELVSKIVLELLASTRVFTYTREDSTQSTALAIDKNLMPSKYLTADEINALPIEIRPECTGQLIKRDIGKDSSIELMEMLYLMQNADNPIKAHRLYCMFRQGLDLLDLDAVTYEMLSMNKNSMGYWLPKMIKPIEDEGFFLIPNTKIAKVPISLLQLSRLDYTSHNKTTFDIVNNWAVDAFNLDVDKHYFIKTGTFSFKFDFRNAKITEPKEVLEIGEYLLFIQSYASSLSQHDLNGRRPITYGVSTTNEWVVREFIEDEEGSLGIYHGLPLHTEYRVFVDFDSDEVLGIHPYWDPGVMKRRFGGEADRNSPDMIHDYITYSAHEGTLMHKYNTYKDEVVKHVAAFIRDVPLTGQWSIDIMQNGDKFWFIDMAVASESAFYEETVLPEKRSKYLENWIPDISTCDNSRINED